MTDHPYLLFIFFRLDWQSYHFPLSSLVRDQVIIHSRDNSPSSRTKPTVLIMMSSLCYDSIASFLSWLWSRRVCSCLVSCTSLSFSSLFHCSHNQIDRQGKESDEYTVIVSYYLVRLCTSSFRYIDSSWDTTVLNKVFRRETSVSSRKDTLNLRGIDYNISSTGSAITTTEYTIVYTVVEDWDSFNQRRRIQLYQFLHSHSLHLLLWKTSRHR